MNIFYNLFVWFLCSLKGDLYFKAFEVVFMFMFRIDIHGVIKEVITETLLHHLVSALRH